MVLPSNKGKALAQIKKIEVVAGFTPWLYIDLINEGKIILTENFSVGATLKKALKNRVDAVYLNIAVGKYLLKTSKRKDALVFDDSIPYSKSAYLLSSIKHPDIIQKFNKFLLSSKSQIDTLKKKYGVYSIN
jgi:polar amino acid transport system substrate-binding protein